MARQLRDRDRSTFVPHMSDVARWQPDRRERRRSVVREVANHVAWLLHQDASWCGSPDPATAPPLGIAVLDALDAVVLCAKGGGAEAPLYNRLYVNHDPR